MFSDKVAIFYEKNSCSLHIDVSEIYIFQELCLGHLVMGLSGCKVWKGCPSAIASVIRAIVLMICVMISGGEASRILVTVVGEWTVVHVY